MSIRLFVSLQPSQSASQTAPPKWEPLKTASPSGRGDAEGVGEGFANHSHSPSQSASQTAPPKGGAFKTSLSLRERWRRRRWRGLVLLKLFVYINYYNIFLHINQRYIKLCIINLRFKSFFRKNFKKTIDKCVLLLYNILCCQVDLSAKIKYSSIAQLVEHSAVNRRVVGSSPTGGATSEQVLLVPIFLSKKSITRSTVPPSHKKSRCRYHLFVIMRLRRNVACFFN